MTTSGTLRKHTHTNVNPIQLPIWVPPKFQMTIIYCLSTYSAKLNNNKTTTASACFHNSDKITTPHYRCNSYRITNALLYFLILQHHHHYHHLYLYQHWRQQQQHNKQQSINCKLTLSSSLLFLLSLSSLSLLQSLPLLSTNS